MENYSIKILTNLLIFSIGVGLSCESKQNNTICNSNSKDVNNYDLIIDPVEDIARFPGCENEESKRNCSDQKFLKYIHENLKYEVVNSEEEVGTFILITFLIEKDGTISNIEPLRGETIIKKSNLIQLLKDMPKWIPGSQNGEPIISRYNLPIRVDYE